MEAAGGEPSSEIFLYLLDACAIARPPLLRELETVWARIEVGAGPCAGVVVTTRVCVWCQTARA